MREGVNPYAVKLLVDIRNIVFHYSGIDFDSTVASIAEWQTNKVGNPLFPEIAYHFYIRFDGTIYQCHGIEKLTWHCGTGSDYSKVDHQGYKVGGNNWESIGVCFAGLYPTEQQLASMKWLADDIDRQLDKQLNRTAHKTISKGLTQCPGEWEEWNAYIR